MHKKGHSSNRGGAIMNKKSVSLYGYHERRYNNLHFVFFWGISICAVVFFFYLKRSIYFTVVLTLFLFLTMGLLTFLWLHISSSQAIFRDNNIAIYRKSGFKKLVEIEKIKDVSIREKETRIAQTRKNKGAYYVLYFKLKNGKRVMLSENVHITTLIPFLKEFSKYYGERIPEECGAHIQEFIKEKEHILKRFEGVSEKV